MTRQASADFSRLDRLVDAALTKLSLIAEGESVLIGVSGGPDSVALLHLLLDRAPARRLHLGIAHLNHQLRDSADRDEEFVRQLAGDLGLPFHGHRADVRARQARCRLSLEEAARQVRYAFFEEVCAANGYAKIALGHHADDNAETLLLHLLRGSGRLGLAGIPAVRAGITIRPLIFATRSDIAEYLRTRGIAYVSDPTNTDSTFLRNRIRHRLIPDLERDYHPGMRAVLSRTALILRAEEEWLDSLVEPIYGSLLTADGEGRVGLSAPALGRLPLAAARRVVRKALIQVKHDLRRVAFDHVEQVLDLVRRTTDAGPLHLPGRVHVRRQGDEIIVSRSEGVSGRPLPDEAPHDFEYRLAGCGGLTILETGDCIRLSEVAAAAIPELAGRSPQTVYMDMAAVEFPVMVRNFRPGDRFSPLGLAGTQKLKKYFIDHKVRREDRRRCPLLISRGRLLWVAGHRLDGRAGLSRQTHRVLKAELFLAKQ
ncbi:MAG: tRNA lysidine(34) synthetase TilS [Deltaproteobacteria bacterium]|nr:tRNA lysidine(34) synthetase TilS [Deltaproteobacteria bacterium]